MAAGYRALMRQCPDVAVAIPHRTVHQVHAFVVEELIARGLAVRC